MKLPMLSRPNTRLLQAPRGWTVDVALLGAMAAGLYLLLAVASRDLARVTPSVTIDLNPAVLPRYALLSLMRMVAAYALSLAFTIVVIGNDDKLALGKSKQNFLNRVSHWISR